LFKSKEVLFLVGGSGLYIDAICNGIDDLPSIPSLVRQKYNQLYEINGLPYIQDLLKTIDPSYYSQVDLNNPKRILKALEVFEITQKPYSSLLSNSQKKRPFDILKIFLDIDRNELYSRINQRVDKMVEAGLEEEARKLIRFKNLTPLNTVGYKELFDYFEGKISREEAITQIKNHTRAYARRQLTWFRRYADAHWFRPEMINEMQELITNSLSRNDN
jgi:tRNA dimethylallyltransferase